MTPNNLDEQLAEYLTDAHAIEQQALAQMKSAPKLAGDAQIAQVFSDHLDETVEHERIVRERLEALAAHRSRGRAHRAPGAHDGRPAREPVRPRARSQPPRSRSGRRRQATRQVPRRCARDRGPIARPARASRSRSSGTAINMLLAIYLNDHLAGVTVGGDLSRRAAASNRDTSNGPFLDDLAREVQEDRESLLAIMRALGIQVDRLKVAGGWGAEKLGRLKLNGRLWGYSPLSRIVELEALALGVRGKLALWRSLQTLEPVPAPLASAGLPELAARAEGQPTGLEEQRLRAVTEALG